jgi:5-methylcytosine-specific restriction endonuclease McrA
MAEWIEIKKDPAHVAREKAKAKELRASSWWKSQLAAGVCHYCKGKFPPEELTMDHVVPIVRGGRSAKGNVVPACKDCNNKKKYLTPVDMILKELEDKERSRGGGGPEA